MSPDENVNDFVAWIVSSVVEFRNDEQQLQAGDDDRPIDRQPSEWFELFLAWERKRLGT